MLNRLSELLPSSTAIYAGDIVIEPTLAGKTRELLLRTKIADKQLLIVCDETTHALLVGRLLQEMGMSNPAVLILDGTPHADEETVNIVRKESYDALIAIGSGTISDICKYASFLDGKSYVVFPTAPSMNGYLSANASIAVKGHKQSLAAHLPLGVFCDLGILASAPKRLILSGLGDSLCRSTAQADWLLSHMLLDTPYLETPFNLLRPYEVELFAHADKLTQGDSAVIELLMKTLLISGLGMMMAKGSYPASQGEHLIAHTMEMKHGRDLPESYHGEQIGVTTLTMAKIQEHVLSHGFRLRKGLRREAAIHSYFGSDMAKSVMQASESKHMLSGRYEEINERLHAQENAIRAAINQIKIPENKLHEVLARAGAPVTPAALGWNERDYELAVSHARFIRDRFTFLDVM